MTNIALHGILGYLKSLNLSSSNKKWLAEHYFAAESDAASDNSDESFFAELAAMPNGDEREAKEIMSDIRSARQSGHTRTISSL